MKFFCWNCHGLGNPATIRELEQLLILTLMLSFYDILRTVGSSVKEDWIVGGDFNAIINDAEKEGGHRKSRVTMDEFRDVMEELTLVDMKTDKDWFTWVNNHDGNNMLVARIDKLIDGPYKESNADMLEISHIKLGYLYAEEESYLAQRSRIKWLKEEDRNTRFFHVRATSKLKKNKIERLKDSNGIWETYDDEILEAFNQMDPCKALGIDCLLGIFFKENCKVVGKDVLNFCHDILDGNKDISCLNDTMIVLIAKIKDSNDMTNFCPISLCRVIYKIISKVLANCLKVPFPPFISKNQSAFVLGRMIHDNVLIAHKLMHYL
ncbi:reverse transcriptase [Gossypium australe]|uniref:Reverse transcriptase n=1 Tax=Gossypium australe TaxID=47621 RepID=A0A5B6VXW8_9ROSI|nr:reverse transcriptase [Gossypium australe]